ncbi:glycosyltransferase family 2 protein [Flavobacterium urumqiense]|uniref:Glycosyltransferase involved in cell wall bisynthesis n=1 Tax=Flavobacterium urumqiense TaxID=935224 RepID=A0A1H5X716_9FLAO|nr:glycosyltransferase family 2 protein [Flavobacterium urumqiense]SEG07423.1 Glycosyltransferase involved in cell wall bisynthesis [Flavobacterium urumqiense]
MPFFSVIIPLFNKEKFIEATLKSVLNQTFIDFEILIINDGSTDNSVTIIEGFDDPRIRYFFKENAGVSSARNDGIEKAQSNYISFIDADDYWYPDFLEEMFKIIQNYPQQKVFSAAIEIETSKKVIPASYSIIRTNDCEIVNYFTASSKETVICTSCAVFHKSIFEETGNFDITVKSGQDTDLWIRIGMNYPVVFSWKILARYIYDENSLSKNKNYLNKKINFSKFEEQEKTNPRLKKFLDLNRFSLAIKSKLIADDENFNCYYKAIDLKNITFKKRFLLAMPSLILKALIHLKLILATSGVGSSVFK